MHVLRHCSVLLLAGGLLVGCSRAADGSAGLDPLLRDMSSIDPETSRRAKLELLRPENAARLDLARDQILEAIPVIASEADALLVGRFDLPEARRQELLTSPHSPDEVRARLGDEDARQRVIAAFVVADSPAALRLTAARLLFVSDPVAMEAFAARLGSKELWSDPHGNRVSVALLLIRAYGLAHPEADLFQVASYSRFADLTEEAFQGAEPQAYLRAIEAHFRDTHQLEVHLDPALLLDTRNVGVRRARSGS